MRSSLSTKQSHQLPLTCFDMRRGTSANASVLHKQGNKGSGREIPPIEKLEFTLITAACKLRLYFQAHTIVVLIVKSLEKKNEQFEDR